MKFNYDNILKYALKIYSLNLTCKKYKGIEILLTLDSVLDLPVKYYM